MTGWDILDAIIKVLPPLAATVLLVAAVVIFIIGFSKHGFNFIKYGFGQEEVGDLSKKIDNLGAEIDGLRAEFKADIEVITVNHFGHLKDFLTELTSILLDKGIINNENKARLDNHLRGM